MNIPRYLYAKYGKGSFEKRTGVNGYILTYLPKNLNLVITYNNEGRVDSNITLKVGQMLTDYVVTTIK
jgi:hypothetical protein